MCLKKILCQDVYLILLSSIPPRWLQAAIMMWTVVWMIQMAQHSIRR